MTPEYTYSSSIKSNASDELINTYFIRPLAGIIVRVFYYTRITPNQVTLFSTLAGFVAASFYLNGTAASNLAAGLLITLKDILDSADGQLARAKNQFSRRGRFLDSIGDLLVNGFVFAAISIALSQSSFSLAIFLLGAVSFLSLTLRVSYHVFYQTSFLHRQSSYTINRVTEEIREEDLRQDRATLILQQLFQLLYGWQDVLMKQIDMWCRGGLEHSSHNDDCWYGDKAGLRISGLMGLGTELFLLTLSSVFNTLEEYLYFNVVLMNGVWLASVVYRRRLSKRMLKSRSSRLL